MTDDDPAVLTVAYKFQDLIQQLFLALFCAPDHGDRIINAFPVAGDDRFQFQGSTDRGGNAADPAASLQILQGVHVEHDLGVVDLIHQAPADLLIGSASGNLPGRPDGKDTGPDRYILCIKNKDLHLIVILRGQADGIAGTGKAGGNADGNDLLIAFLVNLVELLFDLHQVGGRGIGEFGREPSVCHQRIDIHTVLVLLFRIHNVQRQHLDIIFLNDLRCYIR